MARSRQEMLPVMITAPAQTIAIDTLILIFSRVPRISKVIPNNIPKIVAAIFI